MKKNEVCIEELSDLANSLNVEIYKYNKIIEKAKEAIANGEVLLNSELKNLEKLGKNEKSEI